MRIPGILIVLSLAAFSASANPTEVEVVVRDFYRVYAAGDFAAAKAFWTDEGAPSFVTGHARLLRTRCHLLQRLAIRDVAIEGDSATVSTEAVFVRWSALPGTPIDTDREVSTFTLRREDDRWKIHEWRRAEETLVADLKALRDPKERDALLESRPELHTRRLVEILSREIVTLVNRLEMADAKDFIARAHALAATLGDDAALSEVLSAESVFARNEERNHARALDLTRRSVELAMRFGDPDTRARALQRLARAEYEKGNWIAAENANMRALALADHVADASILAHASSVLARMYDGHRRKALKYSFQASAYAKESGDRAAIIASELNLAGNLNQLGDHELSIPHMRTALAEAEKGGFVGVQADLMTALAGREYLAGHGDRVLEVSSRALTLLGSGPVADEARMLIYMSRASYFREVCRDDRAAEEEMQRALRFAPPWPTHTPRLYSILLRIWFAQNRYEEARGLLDLLSEDDPDFPWSMAAILRREGKREEARPHLEKLVRGLEERRTHIDQQRHRAIFFSTSPNYYTELIELHAESGRPGEALAVAEKMKGRVLKDLLASRQDAPSADSEVQLWEADIAHLNRRLLDIQQDGGDTTEVRAQLRQARSRRENAMLRAARPPHVFSKGELDLASVVIPEGTVVIDYVVGSDRTIAFALERGSDGPEMRMHLIPIGAEELEKLSKGFVESIAQRDARYRAAARRLYDLLLAPVLGNDPAVEAVCIIPDLVLWHVPFHALLAPDGRHVVEHARVFYAPSLTMLARQRAEQPRREPHTVLALGDPDIATEMKSEVRAFTRDAILGRLPDAAKEVIELQRMYGERVTVRTGAIAAESIFKEEAADYDVLHLATHGIVDPNDPMYSALLLAASDRDDGMLEAREIVSLPIRADLVVLSACDTARGQVARGEGVLGLSWAILATGCPRVIAAQWRIASASSAQLMIAFHRQLSRQNSVHDVARSLRSAQREMLRSPQTRHPYYWAGFILVGRDW